MRSLLCAAVLVAAAPAPLFSEDVASQGSTVTSSREILSKWVETQQIIARERKDWQQGKEILQARIDLVKGEITALEEKLKEQRTAGSDTYKKRADLGGEEATLKSAATAVGGWVGGLEGQIHELWKSMPEPVKTKLNPLYSRMPADPGQTSISLAERLQNIVGILNEVNKFNSEITMVTEVRTLADGRPAEVRTVYIGLGQAYFVSAGGEAGIGRPAADGWRWESDNSLAASLGQAVEILGAKAKPQFIPLPVKVQ